MVDEVITVVSELKILCQSCSLGIYLPRIEDKRKEQYKKFKASGGDKSKASSDLRHNNGQLS